MQKMKALVVHSANDLRLDEIDVPTPGANEVLVRMAYAGICGSDVSYVKNGASGTAVLKHPLVLGHEVSGVIAALGDGVETLEVGQAVTIYPATVVGDEVLPERLAGRDNLYSQVRYFGSAALDPHTDGGMSEYKLVAADHIIPLPAELDLKRAALAEPLAVGIHAINRVNSVLPEGIAGKPIAINGAGPIGLLLLAAAKQRGASRIVAIDVNEAALERAKALGADEIVNAAKDEIPAGIEIVFETSGVAATFGAVLSALEKGGLLVQVGNLPSTAVNAVLGQLVTREITWIGSYRFIDEMNDAVSLLAAGLNVDAVISHEFELAQGVEAFDVALDREQDSAKILIRLLEEGN